MPKPLPPFEFKQFKLNHDQCAHRIGTDGILLGAWLNIGSAQQLLEFGHGSGLISFMLAQRNPQAQITGIEIDKASYLQSLSNLTANPFQSQIQFFAGDFLSQNWVAKFDFIFSNPPYYIADVLAPQKERARARSIKADLFRGWIQAWYLALKEAGGIALILPPAIWDLFYNDFRKTGFHLLRICEVHHHSKAKVSRVLVELSKEPQATVSHEKLALYRDSPAELRSEAWQKLAAPFLLDQA